MAAAGPDPSLMPPAPDDGRGHDHVLASARPLTFSRVLSRWLKLRVEARGALFSAIAVLFAALHDDNDFLETFKASLTFILPKHHSFTSAFHEE